MDIVKILDPWMDNIPQEFKCPISMELMKNPVTISTGVTYERKSIEKYMVLYLQEENLPRHKSNYYQFSCNPKSHPSKAHTFLAN